MPHKKLAVTETGSVDNDTTQTGGVAARGVTAGAVITPLGQSWQEVQRPVGPIVVPKQRTTICCWNVRTMVEATSGILLSLTPLSSLKGK